MIDFYHIIINILVLYNICHAPMFLKKYILMFKIKTKYYITSHFFSILYDAPDYYYNNKENYEFKITIFKLSNNQSH